MIEVNLIPDVKRELLRARRTRSTVISISILAMLGSGAVVVVLALYVFGAQSLLNFTADSKIKDEYKTLSGVKDLSKTLTIQNQLANLSTLQEKSLKTSRMFNILSVIVPTNENAVAISNFKFDDDEDTVTMEAEAVNGYEALEVFKKTIAETKIRAGSGDDIQESALASDIVDGERSYGEDSNGQKVLRFTISFNIESELLAEPNGAYEVVGPSSQIATDSATGVPKSLFTDRTEDQ